MQMEVEMLFQVQIVQHRIFNAVKESDEIDPINILRRELAHENIGYYTTK